MHLTHPFSSLLVLSFISLSLFFTTATFATPAPTPTKPNNYTYIIHESRSAPPPLWTRVRRYRPSPPTSNSTSPNQNTLIPLKIGLKQPNLSSLPSLLHSLSDPNSKEYGKWWSAGDVRDMFKAGEESVRVVGGWVRDVIGDGGNVRVTPSGGWLRVDVSVEQMEALLKTEYWVWRHGETGDEHVACMEYHLPDHVAPHVELILPSIHFDAVLRKRSSAPSPHSNNLGRPNHPHAPKSRGTMHASHIWTKDLEKCDEMMTPPCLRALYGIEYDHKREKRDGLAIVEYTPQAYLQSDLDMFALNFSMGMQGREPRLVSIDGGVVQTIQQEFSYNGESNLDLQYAMHLINAPDHPPSPSPSPSSANSPHFSYGNSYNDVTLYQVGDLPQGATFNNLLDALDGSYCSFLGGDDPTQDGWYPDEYPGGYRNATDCGIVKPANVISTSYGYNEADLSLFYATRQCMEYAKLGLMGVTVIYSSGDSGVAGNGDFCLNPDGSHRISLLFSSQSEEGRIFNPGFPSTCPYITSIGATQINPGSKVTDPESACGQVIRSGGGFSNYFEMPPYQRERVGRWMGEYAGGYGEGGYEGVWNASGKSRGYPDISANGANYMVAVNGIYHKVFGTSAAAPVVASIFALINDARLEIGKKPVGFVNPVLYSDLFTDALNDITSGSNEGCGTPGFSAVPGWDPVTGLGTPSFPRMLERWLRLP
ncbi:peptidase S8/S53 domain-containing protein [Panaeolus papilionaceus]|nr:peptidase S8/S53 domain-containing protein [Panaeolus papilionaceus]